MGNSVEQCGCKRQPTLQTETDQVELLFNHIEDQIRLKNGRKQNIIPLFHINEYFNQMIENNQIGDNKDGKVFRVLNHQYKQCTIKQVFIEDQAEVFNVIKRLGYLTQMLSPNINKVVQIGMGSEYKMPILYLMYPFVECNLKQIMTKENLRNLTIQMKIQIALQLARSIETLHKHKNLLIHGNLRPENVLIQYQEDNAPRVIVTDACIYSKNRDILQHKGKKDSYISPETRVNIDGSLSRESDMWSLGLILFQLFSEETLAKAKTEKQVISILENCSSINEPNLMQAIKKCLSFTSDERPRITQTCLVIESMKSKYQFKPVFKLNFENQLFSSPQDQPQKYDSSFSTENTNQHLEDHTMSSDSKNPTSRRFEDNFITPRKKLQQILSIRSFEGVQHSNSPEKQKDIQNMLFQANIFYIKGETMEGLQQCEEALIKDPQNLEIMYMKAQGYRILGENYRKNFKNIITQIVQSDPTTYDNLCFLVQVIIKQSKQYQKAITVADQAIQIDPERPQAYLWKGIAYFHQDNIEKCLQTLDKCLSRCNEQDTMALSLQAYGLTLIDEFEESEIFFQKSENLDPTSSQLYYFQAKAAENAFQFDTARSFYQKSHQIDPLDEQILFDYILFLIQLRTFEPALLCNKILSEFTSAPERISIQRGVILLMMRKIQEALKIFRATYAMCDSESINTYQFIIKNYEIKCLIILERFKEADETISSILIEEPRHQETLINKAYLLQKNKKFDEAQAVLLKVLTIEPKSIQSYMNIARISQLTSNTGDALSYYEQALKYDRQNAPIFFLKACSLKKLGKNDEAGEAIDQMNKFKTKLFDHFVVVWRIEVQEPNDQAESHLENIQEIESTIDSPIFTIEY